MIVIIANSEPIHQSWEMIIEVGTCDVLSGYNSQFLKDEHGVVQVSQIEQDTNKVKRRYRRG